MLGILLDRKLQHRLQEFNEPTSNLQLVNFPLFSKLRSADFGRDVKKKIHGYKE